MAEKKTYGRSKAGAELSDDALQRMAKEAEIGLDLTKLRRRRGRPPMGSGPADTPRSGSIPSYARRSTTGPRLSTRPPRTSSGTPSAGTSRSAENRSGM